ncbi:abortive infection family protein [Streptomyces sp. GbtcB7]|uniref:abortive infection family protein n=1 Tax=Streptomyces sp. GbtcB7 TaxID=2824752 RepID=UPI001C30924F|nr:abortive infection family protein [Streptomyces sp. GbtcB7]
MLREGVRPETVVLAVAKAIEAKFSRSDWIELSLLTGVREEVVSHDRLLRSLNWGDDDYFGHVADMVPLLLGASERQPGSQRRSVSSRFPNFAQVEQFLDLPAWLRTSEPDLYAKLYGGPVPVDALQAAAAELGVIDVDEHAVRIRRGLREDPAQAIGSAKELLETVLKSILGLHGTGKETKLDVPVLLRKANVQLGLDAGGVRGSDAAAEQRRRMLGSLAQLVISTAELRNAGFGTGHGLSQRPELDVPTARMVVAAAVTVAQFYIEAHAATAQNV